MQTLDYCQENEIDEEYVGNIYENKLDEMKKRSFQKANDFDSKFLEKRESEIYLELMSTSSK